MRLTVNELVREAVAGNLVSCRGNALHQARRFLGYPPEHEERATDFPFRQQIQDALGIGFDAVFARRPAIAGNGAGERGYLEVVLDVDREGIDGAVQRFAG